MSVGYSGTPLPRKLGIKEGHCVAIPAAPDSFDLALPVSVAVRHSLRGTRPFDVVLLFAPRASVLRRRFAPAAARLTPAGGLWVAWPKKASGLQTDVGEALVRAHGLQSGLVDNKICAIDETWSGLRFVVRLKDRR